MKTLRLRLRSTAIPARDSFGSRTEKLGDFTATNSSLYLYVFQSVCDGGRHIDQSPFTRKVGVSVQVLTRHSDDERVRQQMELSTLSEAQLLTFRLTLS